MLRICGRNISELLTGHRHCCVQPKLNYMSRCTACFLQTPLPQPSVLSYESYAMRWLIGGDYAAPAVSAPARAGRARPRCATWSMRSSTSPRVAASGA